MRKLFLLCVLFATQHAGAEPVTVPSGLEPGEKYRIAFLTTSEISAGKSIAEYNAFVQAQADAVAELSALGAEWKAIASTHEIEMAQNTGTDPDDETGFPIYLLNGRRIAENNADLWDGSLEGHIRVYPNGEFEPFSVEVMARGIGPDRFNIGNQIDVGALPTNFCEMGNCRPDEPHPPQQATTWDWIAAYDQPRGSFRMYAMSSVLTVVPEPSSELSLSIGTLCLLLSMRGSRHCKKTSVA